MAEPTNHDPLLLCTDLDGTVIPRGEVEVDGAARRLFDRFVAHPAVALVYVTGRDRARVEAALAEHALPLPHAVIADVGGSIYTLGDTWTRDEEWDARIAAEWRSLTSGELADEIGELVGAEPQDPSRQGTYKLSYRAPLDCDRGRVDEGIRETLDRLGVTAVRVWSVDELQGEQLLDVLPASATKDGAVTYLRDRMGFELENTVFAGDSGNDLAVLAGPTPSVLVANAREEIADKARALAAVRQLESAFYVAQGGWRGLSGALSGGILEGVAHYHPERVARILEDLEAQEAAR